MSLQQRRDELTRKISEVRDEQVLEMLEQELSYLLYTKSADITDILSEHEFRELSTLASEPSAKDSINEEEFKNLLRKWRTG